MRSLPVFASRLLTAALALGMAASPGVAEERGACAGAFRTQTQGGWGSDAAGDNPGAYCDAYFGEAFPEGLVIGADAVGVAGPSVLFTKLGGSSSEINTCLDRINQNFVDGRTDTGRPRPSALRCRATSAPTTGPSGDRARPKAAPAPIAVRTSPWRSRAA
jgi:hypothetical protein